MKKQLAYCKAMKTQIEEHEDAVYVSIYGKCFLKIYKDVSIFDFEGNQVTVAHKDLELFRVLADRYYMYVLAHKVFEQGFQAGIIMICNDYNEYKNKE